MPNNWKTYKLGEIVDVKQGLAINKKTDHLLTDKSSMPLFKIRDLINNTVEHYVKEDEVPKQCIANYEDLIYSRTGQVGLVFRGKIGCIHNNCFKIIPNESIINKDLLFWFLKQPEIIEYANNIASGSVQKDLNHTAFKSIEISISDNINEQKNIAEIFNIINDKIENNLAINKTLEEMAMALYKHWFVDFGPFQDGEFVESELGRIPKGWEVKNLGDLYETTSGGTPSRTKMEYYENGTIQWIKSKELDNTFIINTEEKITDFALSKSSAKMFPAKSVLIAMYGATVGEIAINSEIASCNQAICAIKQTKLPYFYVFLFLKNEKENILNQAVGSAQQNISQIIIKNLQLLNPNIEDVKELFNELNAIFNKLEANIRENQTLTQLRDTLLPKLISGEVRLKEFVSSEK